MTARRYNGERKRARIHEKLRRELQARRDATRFKPVQRDNNHAERKH